MTDQPVSTKSSGNPFADFAMKDAETRLAKARLAMEINAIMLDRKLTQVQLADWLGIDQPQVSKIIRGQLKDFSLDKLLELVRRLNMDIEIVVRENHESSRPAKMTVNTVLPDVVTASNQRDSDW